MNNQPKDERAELKVSELAEAIQLRLVAEGILTYERDTPISPQLQAQAAAIQKGIDDYATHIPPATSKSVDELARECAEKIVNALIGDKRDFADEYEKTLMIIAPYLADEKGVCNWTSEGDPDYNEGRWTSDCGNDFLLTEGTPSENKLKFCCWCGKSLTETRTAEQEKE